MQAALSKWGIKWNKIAERKQSKLEKVQECNQSERKQAIFQTLSKWIIKSKMLTERKQSNFDKVQECKQ